MVNLNLFTFALLGIILASSAGFSYQEAFAANVTWDAGGDGATWSDPLNWDTNTLPQPNDDVFIPFITFNNTILTSTFCYYGISFFSNYRE